jgi:hypothetical protein
MLAARSSACPSLGVGGGPFNLDVEQPLILGFQNIRAPRARLRCCLLGLLYLWLLYPAVLWFCCSSLGSPLEPLGVGKRGDPLSQEGVLFRLQVY